MRKFLTMIACALLWQGTAHATLGQSYETSASAATFTARGAATAKAAYTLHEATDTQGTLVREYVDNNGFVFAVAWQGAWRPDLNLVLGSYAGAFQHNTSNDSARIAGRYPIHVTTNDLVIHSGGHLRAFWGIAYLQSKVPSGVDATQLH